MKNILKFGALGLGWGASAASSGSQTSPPLGSSLKWSSALKPKQPHPKPSPTVAGEGAHRGERREYRLVTPFGERRATC